MCGLVRLNIWECGGVRYHNVRNVYRFGYLVCFTGSLVRSNVDVLGVGGARFSLSLNILVYWVLPSRDIDRIGCEPCFFPNILVMV